MTDITNTNLEAALLDQKVAGAFEMPYAFVAVINKDGWQLGVAVANECGYHPIDGKTFADELAAREWADGLNRHIGLTADDAMCVVISTMCGRA
ncbi:MAG TPA: hypothetical protein VM867_08310 [Xanthobacteraceae bacterium]|nr:hypothetical protein [Xanthobacteraceae bacterium]